jgi:hypothetical protein
VTLWEIDDIVEKVKLSLNKKKIFFWSADGALIVFVIWFVTSLALDYFSHIDTDEPLFP